MKFIRIFLAIFVLTNFSNIAHPFSGSGPLKFFKIDFENFLAYMRGDGSKYGEVGKKKGTPAMFAINKEGQWSYYMYCPIKYNGNCREDIGPVIQGCSKQSKKQGYGRCFLFANKRKIVWDGKNIRLPRKYDQAYIERVFKENGWYGKSKSVKNESSKSNNPGGYNFCSDYTIKLSSCKKAVSFQKFVKDYLTTRNKSEPDPSSLTDQDLFDRELKNLKTAFGIYNLDTNRILEEIYKNKKLSSLYKNSREKITDKAKQKKLTKNNDTVEQLKKLNDLYKSGVLTEEEFTKAKKKILD